MEGFMVDISERKLMEMQSQQARAWKRSGDWPEHCARLQQSADDYQSYAELARDRTEGRRAAERHRRIDDATERPPHLSAVAGVQPKAGFAAEDLDLTRSLADSNSCCAVDGRRHSNARKDERGAGHDQGDRTDRTGADEFV